MSVTSKDRKEGRLPWFLVQTHHSIRCSHKRYRNCHLYQHRVFCYFDEAQASLCKCADSPEDSLPAHEILITLSRTMPAHMCKLTRVYPAIVNSTPPFESAHEILFGAVKKAKLSLCKCADSPEP